MKVQEFYLLYEARRPRNPEEDYAGGLTEKDCRELFELME